MARVGEPTPAPESPLARNETPRDALPMDVRLSDRDRRRGRGSSWLLATDPACEGVRKMPPPCVDVRELLLLVLPRLRLGVLTPSPTPKSPAALGVGASPSTANPDAIGDTSWPNASLPFSCTDTVGEYMQRSWIARWVLMPPCPIHTHGIT